MPPIKGGGTVVKIDTVVVARVSSIQRDLTFEEIDTSGFENVSGGLVQKQFETIAIDETLQLEGTAIDAVAARLEPGQSALYTAATTGASAVLQVVDKNGYGFDFTGQFTSYTESATVTEAWKFTGSFRVNASAPVTPA